ncbi:MAG: ATP-binding cassette domain-containing protein [Ferruginibacter sp.]
MAKQTSLSSALIKLHRLVMTDKKDVSAVYFFAIAGGLISLTLPLGIQTIISFVMAATLSTSIVILIIIVIGGVFLNGFVQVRQLQVIERIRQKIFTRYSLEFSNQIPKIDAEAMDNYYLPEVVNRFFDIPALAKSIEKILLDIPASVIQIILGLVLLSFYHPVFIVFGIFVFVALIFILRITSPKGFETNFISSDYKYETAGWLEEMARAAKTFKFSKDAFLHMKKSDKIISGYLTSRTAHFKILTIQYWSLIVFKILIVSSMLIAGTWLLLNQEINVGQFIAADIIIILIISSVEKLIAVMDNVYESLTAIEKLSKIIDSKSEVSGALLFTGNTGSSIKFINVGYTYPDGSVALNSVNLSIPNKQIVCVTGKSGAGRTTILRLLTGSYTSFTGGILINDIPIGNYDLASLRLNTGAMLPEQDIFKGTLLENLTMGNDNISMDEIMYLSDKIGFTDFVTANKMGYNMLLDPTGSKISKHLTQSVKLIRALVGKPSLLLMEDLLKNLLPEHKVNIMNYIRNESNATTLIISNDEIIHKLSDAVITIENGTIKN